MSPGVRCAPWPLDGQRGRTPTSSSAGPPPARRPSPARLRAPSARGRQQSAAPARPAGGPPRRRRRRARRCPGPRVDDHVVDQETRWRQWSNARSWPITARAASGKPRSSGAHRGGARSRGRRRSRGSRRGRRAAGGGRACSGTGRRRGRPGAARGPRIISCGSADVALDVDARRPRHDGAEGRASDEGVAAPALPALHRFEQEARAVADTLQEGPHRGEGVGDHLAPHRDHRVVLGQRPKLLGPRVRPELGPVAAHVPGALEGDGSRRR